MRRLALAALLGGLGPLAAPSASAEPGVARAEASASADVDHLLQNLAAGSDFRIRTQAALSLGASKSRRAVEPLCTGLGDANATVRAASAAALGRLRLGGSECLQRRLALEPSDTVKSAIRKALDPVFTSDTKYYLAIGKTSDKTGRSGDEIDAIVHAAMASAASSLPIYAVAPSGENLVEAKRRLAPHKDVKSVFLSPKVPPPEYSGGNLTMRIEIAMFSYPDKALIGSFTQKLTQQGVSSPDKDTENDLLREAATRALEKFTKAAPNLH